MANWSVVSGQQDVAAAGTAEALVASTVAYRYVREVTIKAKPGNAGNMYVGNDNANDVTSTNGYPLAPGDSISFSFVNFPGSGDERIDLNSIYVDADTSADDVQFIALTDV